MYELKGVSKNYRRGRSTVMALMEVDLRIGEGDFLAIQGPTGQGKTTLLQLLGALDRPTSGSVLFEGQDLATMREARLTELRSRSFGFVFQGFNLIPTLTAQENVETALVPRGVRVSERRTRARAALADVGLADRARHLPSELSGGEQQRAAIARALVRDPRVILADEPSGNLDERTRDEIIGLLEKLWADRGQTLVMVTHDSWIASRAPTRAWIYEHPRAASNTPRTSDGTPRRIPAGPHRGAVHLPLRLPSGVGSVEDARVSVCPPRPCSKGSSAG